MDTASTSRISLEGSGKYAVPHSCATAFPRAGSASHTPVKAISENDASFWACRRPRYPTPMTPTRNGPPPAMALPQDPALARPDEVDQSPHLRERLHFRIDLREGVAHRGPGPEQDPVGFFQRRDRLLRELVPLQADDVQAIEGRPLRRARHDGGHVRGHVLRDSGERADHRELPDPHELVDPDEPADDRADADLDVPGKRRGIGHHHPVSHLAVVGDVAVGHEERLAAQAGHSPAVRRPAIHRHVLADRVAVPDLHPGVLPLEFQILRGGADGGEREHAVVLPHADVRGDLDVGGDVAPVADRHLRTDHGEGADRDAFAQLRLGVDDRGGMDHLPAPSGAFSADESGIVAIRSASATRASPTRASPCFFPPPIAFNARIPPVCASASTIRTPGMTGWPGKWPAKNGSLIVTFFSPTIRTPGSYSTTRSTSR